MDDELDELRRNERRRKLVEPATIYGRFLGHERARQHLMEGFNRRVYMLARSIEVVHDIVEDAEGRPLSSSATSEVAIHVNALWLNLCGALDNLAWALAYEWNLFPGVGEGRGEGRDSIGLVKKPFIGRVADRDPVLGEQLRAAVKWQTDLRDLRDPSAHRIPIYPVPAVMDEETGREAQRLFEESNRLAAEGRFEEGLDALARVDCLGRYVPVFTLSHAGRLEVRHLHNQIRTDDAEFVELSAGVLNRLFGAFESYRAI